MLRSLSPRRVVTHPSDQVTVRATDGVRLALRVVGDLSADTVWVIGHGFTNSTAKPTSAVVRRFLAARGDGVLALDFRGHGRSGGVSSVGRDEHRDLDAAVAHARAAGAGRVVVLGFSMGASVALRHAALGEHRPDVVVSVSSPSRWYIRETPSMRRVQWLAEHPLGRTVGRFLGVRLGTTWEQLPPTPLELMDRIAPLPLLLVHGTDDHYFPVQHAHALHRAADHGELWIEPGMGHAESGLKPGLLARIHRWAHSPAAVQDGSRPIQPAS